MALPAKLIEVPLPLFLQKYRQGKQSSKESTDNSKDGRRLILFKLLISLFINEYGNFFLLPYFSLVPLIDSTSHEQVLWQFDYFNSVKKRLLTEGFYHMRLVYY